LTENRTELNPRAEATPGPGRRGWRPGWFIILSVAIHLIAIAIVVWQPETWPWALAVVAANHLLITALGLWPQGNWLGSNWSQLPKPARLRGEIALTIDDGPDPVVTPKVLDILDCYQVKASFFCIGKQALAHRELCREIIRRGHAIENHSMHHFYRFSTMGVRGLRREVGDAQRVLTEITGQSPRFFRAPAGLRNLFLDPVLERLGLQLSSWSVRGFDTSWTSPQRIRARMVGRLKAGAIVLMHDGNAAIDPNGQSMIEQVLPGLIETAFQKGLKFVTLKDALS
jgi:peptidoglycan/xylan/chitin deacetylase (PgdA/CDA1 family)